MAKRSMLANLKSVSPEFSKKKDRATLATPNLEVCGIWRREAASGPQREYLSSPGHRPTQPISSPTSIALTLTERSTISPVSPASPSAMIPSTDAPQRHPRFWLDDGSLVLRTSTGTDAYKVHRTLLARHSPFIASLAADDSLDGSPVVRIPEERGVSSADLEALLEHLYHDAPLDTDSPFPRIASVLRASSAQQLDLPSIHSLARHRLEALFPTSPVPFFETDRPDDALTLAVEYDVYPIQKILFYTVATHTHLEHDEPPTISSAHTHPDPPSPSDPAPASAPHLTLSPTLTTRCQSLLASLLSHFTPVLFTVPTASHMPCTDALAEAWMPRVIAPALAADGLCRPLETLQTIIDIDWAARGVCQECVVQKREEWCAEQRAVWEKMDGWLGLEGIERFTA
ncbi:uncharacterized protein LAESUDRAFT_816729 [Laetiporus sulphureus 93-53]|uniref:BTB domain-containing protein n=1 Tax=Laetiporus sulphureus 93-53 TaxID=1314785 RepID=A0A165B1J4_9APHY|nr:uncharacterized protein LAESUDRAFT_816729 [Laetiporus sulphureus 93-53]KZT00056.1 hypothetical protein LAESUDRAFT_816729 [Laetiporus sulphureus 93-53]